MHACTVNSYFHCFENLIFELFSFRLDDKRTIIYLRKSFEMDSHYNDKSLLDEKTGTDSFTLSTKHNKLKKQLQLQFFKSQPGVDVINQF